VLSKFSKFKKQEKQLEKKKKKQSKKPVAEEQASLPGFDQI